MADRRLPLDGPALERALADLGGRIAFPSAPDLAARVRDRIGARTRRRWSDGLRPWPRALALAALIVVLGGALLAIAPGVRSAVADLFGLRGVRFLPVTVTPPPATPAATIGARLFLGDPVTLAEAQGRVDFPIRMPVLRDLGAPDAVYVAGLPPDGLVSLVYGPQPGLPETRETGVGLLIMQFRGDFEEPFLQKGLPAGARLEMVMLDGRRAYWIEGAAHVVMIRDGRGRFREERSRLAGNTLLWERDGITYRLESALTRDDALQIAASMR